MEYLEKKISALVWNKEVEIIYQDMDGQPCKCNAICEKPNFNNAYFRATDGMAKGNKMCDVIAYRPITKQEFREVKTNDRI